MNAALTNGGTGHRLRERFARCDVGTIPRAACGKRNWHKGKDTNQCAGQCRTGEGEIGLRGRLFCVRDWAGLRPRTEWKCGGYVVVFAGNEVVRVTAL